MKVSLTEKLGDDYNIDIQAQKNPRMKVLNINNNMSQLELENDINKRNFSHTEGQCKVQHLSNSKSSKCAIIELPSNLYKIIRSNDNSIYIGYERCKAYDDFNMSLCGKCGGYGHGVNTCDYGTNCIKCAGNHSIYDCTENIVKCFYCVNFNEKSHKNRSADHMASEVDECDTHKSKFKHIIESTDYPILPTTPTTLHYQKSLRIPAEEENEGERKKQVQKKKKNINKNG